MKAAKFILGTMVFFLAIMSIIHYFSGTLEVWNYYRTAIIGAALGGFNYYRSTKRKQK